MAELQFHWCFLWLFKNQAPAGSLQREGAQACSVHEEGEAAVGSRGRRMPRCSQPEASWHERCGWGCSMHVEPARTAAPFSTRSPPRHHRTLLLYPPAVATTSINLSVTDAPSAGGSTAASQVDGVGGGCASK